MLFSFINQDGNSCAYDLHNTVNWEFCDFLFVRITDARKGLFHNVMSLEFNNLMMAICLHVNGTLLCFPLFLQKKTTIVTLYMYRTSMARTPLES